MFQELDNSSGQYLCSKVTAILGISVLLLLGGTPALAQTPASATPAQDAMTSSADQNRQLNDQITELRAQVAKLQAAVHQAGRGGRAFPPSGMKGREDEMGMLPADDVTTSGSAGVAMKQGEGETGGMPPANASMPSGMNMANKKAEMGGMAMGGKTTASPGPDAAMGMCCGKKASSGSAATAAKPPGGGGTADMSSPSSATPGQTGVSRLYHIGSNGFFLNHSKHITLTPDQTLTLNRVKEKAILDRASEQRRIDQSEEELYALTGADRPDNGRIRTKIVEGEKLRVDQRMNFIRAVEEASNVLTPEQREVLLGTVAATQR